MIVYLIRHGQSSNNLLGETIFKQFGEFNRDIYMRERVPEPPLTETGEAQAACLGTYLHNASPKHHRTGYEDPPNEESIIDSSANKLGITRLYCSPMLRTMQTVRPVAEALNLSPSVWIDLHEHGGVFHRPAIDAEAIGYPGLNRSEMAEMFPVYSLDGIGQDGWWFGGEEDRAACHGRAVRVAEALRQMAVDDTKNERIAAVSHGTFLDSLLKALLGRLPGNDFHFNHYNTGITRIDFTRSHTDGSLFMIIRYTNRVDHLRPDLIT